MARVVTFCKCCLFSLKIFPCSKQEAILCFSSAAGTRGRRWSIWEEAGMSSSNFSWEVPSPHVSNYYSLLIHQIFLREGDWEFLAFQKTEHFEIRGSLFLDSRCCWQGMLQQFILVGVSYGLMAMWLEMVHFRGPDEKWQIFLLGFRPVR